MDKFKSKLFFALFLAATPLISYGSETIDEKKDKCPLNFLTTTYPKLAEEAKKPFQLATEEQNVLDQCNQKDMITFSFKDGLGMEPYHEKTIQFNIGEQGWLVKGFVKLQLDTLKENHPTQGFYTHFFNKFLEPKHLMESLMLSTEYMYQMIQEKEPGVVLFLGRSSCLLHEAYDGICTYFNTNNIKKENKHPSVHLSFSGHPDRDIKRNSD